MITENASAGTDTVQTGVTYTLGANLENLVLTGTATIGVGNGLDNYLTGNASANTFTGGGGNDTLDGAAGADSLTGGAGDDTYFVDSLSDVVAENSSEGTDTIKSSITYTLGSSSNVENLTLTGIAAVNATGNSGNNVLTGNAAANSLNGGGGDDTMLGGLGNDYYFVDHSTADIVTENAGEGTDTVQTTASSYTLGANVENLVLSGGAQSGEGNTLNNSLTGTSAHNTLTGNAGHDTLDGGTGDDSLIGGTGDDTYIIDHATLDVLTEGSAEGTDTVQSSVSYTLAANFENLTLTGGAALGVGNSVDNYLLGNSSANTLSGGAGNDTLDGGAGVDSMTGGTGNDTFYVDSTSDIVTENSGEGIDSVVSSVNYTLSSTLEHLSLGGTGDITATGHSGNNVIAGNSGANTITGAAGANTITGAAGSDTLQGGSGSDSYIFALGDGTDLISESGGTLDKVVFAAGIDAEDIAIFMNGDDLQIGYLSGSDLITVDNQTLADQSIERLQLNDGSYLTAADVNQIIQQMSTYAADHGLGFTTLTDVKNSDDLMTIVSSSWHAA